jgi:hypothetical protein
VASLGLGPRLLSMTSMKFRNERATWALTDSVNMPHCVWDLPYTFYTPPPPAPTPSNILSVSIFVYFADLVLCFCLLNLRFFHVTADIIGGVWGGVRRRRHDLGAYVGARLAAGADYPSFARPPSSRSSDHSLFGVRS